MKTNFVIKCCLNVKKPINPYLKLEKMWAWHYPWVDIPTYHNSKLSRKNKKNPLFQKYNADAVLRLPGADALGRPLATTF